jgi:hypothetical protein
MAQAKHGLSGVFPIHGRVVKRHPIANWRFDPKAPIGAAGL